MALEYEAAVRLARDAISTADIDGSPVTFEPPAWVVRAVERAYKLGHAEGAQWQRGIDAGLYPEGG